ncbi:structural maintenance of chromosomes protein 3 [Diachasma alloeum]|uniref:Structural maintenance of chromosomes 3C n=1 Tax=Diachasma alloeum TaxID=454923 RepID=A0A4E0RYU7_9HYME|nr:structural maintenance of chromosomes protein 3 [Diachasma alloeum]THK32941.1 structural maintenance of chromosomes 3C [Diachasma alloeum]
MHIKQIVIENFKSYRGHHVFDGLHPGHNAIVGLNGSGKSSLLESISFVLSDRYYPIPEDQRFSVINNSPINHTRSASVEIILSNDDNVLSVDAPEVRIRRVISLEFDRITINNESFEPADLFQLLSPVFPRENPYHIIRPDDVAHLVTGSVRFKLISTAIGLPAYQKRLEDLLSKISKKTEFLSQKKPEIVALRETLSLTGAKNSRLQKLTERKRYLDHKLCTLTVGSLTSHLRKLDEELLRVERAKEACSQLPEELQALSLEESEIKRKLQGLKSGELQSFAQRRQNLVFKISALEEESQMLEEMLLKARKTVEEAPHELEAHEEQMLALFRRRKALKSSPQVSSKSPQEEVLLENEELESKVAQILSQKIESEERLNALEKQLRAAELQLCDHKRQREKFLESRQYLLGDVRAASLHDDIEALTKDVTTIRQQLQLEGIKDVLEGIESVRKILKAWRKKEGMGYFVNGVKGVFLDVFTIRDPGVALAVEVRGADKLFHHVVRDQEVIDEIMFEKAERKLGGIVKFISLKDIRRQRVRPLTKEFDYLASYLVPREEEFKKAVDFVFGDTVVVRNTKVEVEAARRCGLRWITREGKQDRGKVRGDQPDGNFSLVGLYELYRESRDKLEDMEIKWRGLLRLEELDFKVSEARQHFLRLEFDTEEGSIQLERINRVYMTLKRSLEEKRMRFEESRRKFLAAGGGIEELGGTSVDGVEAAMEELRRESSLLRRELEAATGEIRVLEGRLESLRTILLRHREEKDDLELWSGDCSPDLLRTRLAVIQEDQRRILEREKGWKAAKEHVEMIKFRVDTLEMEIKGLREWDLNQGPVPLVQDAGIFEALGKEELQARIRDLGRDEEALGAVEPGIKGKMEALEGHLKALEDLVVKEEERKRSYVVEVERIEAERVEALRAGFERINEFFGEIFGEIVVNGRARLYPVDEDGGEVEDGDWGRVRGVRMRATFGGGQEVERMHQLSGGQKTVIALTLIFAVHRFKPAPFYLLDEIDKALDESFRASVAGLVHGLSGSAQFLIITFREELLMQAQRYFKVTSRHDCSHVEGCSREEAVEIIRSDPEEEWRAISDFFLV